MMNRKKLILNALALTGSFTILHGAMARQDNVNPNQEEKSYSVETFSALKASRGVNVNISIGSEQSIKAIGPKGKMDRVEVFVKDDTLHVRRTHRKRGWGWSVNSGKFVVTIVSPTLEAIDVSSGADVFASKINSPTFTLDSSSGADIKVSGTCGSLTADASSGADIDARALECKTVIADASSGADIDVYASEGFIGEASSGSDINVLGSPPKVDKTTSSGGDIDVR